MHIKQIDILNNQLYHLESFINNQEHRNSKVSISNIGWHLYHSLMVINGVCGILLNTKPENYKPNFNLKRAVLFPLGYIPRGQAKAPKVVLPLENFSTEELHEQLNLCKKHIESIKLLHEKSYFTHHIFGMLTKKQTLRFLAIHTEHHLKIANDILKAHNRH